MEYSANTRISVLGRIFGNFWVPNIHIPPKVKNPVLVKHWPDLLQLLVGGRVGDEEAVAVAHRHAPQDPAAAHGGVNHGDDLVLLWFWRDTLSMVYEGCYDFED